MVGKLPGPWEQQKQTHMISTREDVFSKNGVFHKQFLFDHAQGTEGRASPNPCFVLHASIVCFFRLPGLVIERVIPGNYHLCIAIYRGKKTSKYVHGMVLAIFYAKTHLFSIKMA